LLAKDGIYINDYPRDLKVFPIPMSGRADIMVRCKKAGTYTVTHGPINEPLFTIVSEGDPVKKLEEPTANHFNSTSWVKNLPLYLQDVQHKPVRSDCSCPTIFDATNDNSATVNRKRFQPNEFVHIVKLGEVIERKLTGVNFHPYHQHVYPFQLTKGFDKDKNEWQDASIDSSQGGYFKNGDWHDVIKTGNQVGITIKYHPQKVLGRMMIHCHILPHEDTGMMSSEKIVIDHNCDCNRTKMDENQLLNYDTKMAFFANFENAKMTPEENLYSAKMAYQNGKN